MQYSGKYSRRGLNNERMPRRMPYMRTGRCGCDTNNDAFSNESYENRMPRNDACDICDIVNLDSHNNQDRCAYDHKNNCACDHNDYDTSDWCNQQFSLAMGYVYPQNFEDLNESDEALCRGTLFRKLDMPFYGSRKRH